MDYRKLISFHQAKGADVTVASLYVDEHEATRMGVLDCAPSGRLLRLVEKPSDVRRLKVKTKSVLTGQGKQQHYCASMGIYLFNKNVLFDVLLSTKADDFGKHILPLLVKKDAKVFAYDFQGYWRDIGTIKSYYEASMDLLREHCQFDLFNERWPLFTRARFLPPSKIVDSGLANTLIADGCQITKAEIENSIIGLRSIIKENTKIRDSVIIGNDYYQAESEGKMVKPCIGKGVIIERAIVDKNATIGDFCHITDKSHASNMDGDMYYIRDGITIIRRGAVLPPHSIL
jgi:ADP-glucose pyrophosphorylase